MTNAETSEGSCEIAPSELGTKNFWDRRYELEFENFQSFGDEGEIWFGTSAENRIVKYLIDSKVDKKSAKILDMGCGNGSVLRKLRSQGFRNLKGVDYCDAAVQLSRGLAETEKTEEPELGDIEFEQLDILNPSDSFFETKYEVILDKGTWDAMSLSEERESRLFIYIEFLKKSLAENGKFVIFSCNFTIEELTEQFGNGEVLKFLCEVPASHTFSFGGKEGVTSTGAVFHKNC